MKILELNHASGQTEIILKRGLLKEVDFYLDQSCRYFIISEENIPKKIQNTLLSQLQFSQLYLIPTSEKAKSLEVVKACLSKLMEENFGRNDKIIALGGGVVGDIAGFIASIYLRGITWIQIPTTTLAQVDSSVGGKTAINFNGVKNGVGSIWQPEQVLIDVETLDSLDERNYYNGMIEALKMGILFDSNLVKIFEDLDIKENQEEIIFTSIALKKNIVEEDEYEEGKRRLLNFGHTIGHGIESAQKGEFLHGECVGLGMLAMIDDHDLYQRVQNILKKMKCPTEANGSIDQYLQYIKHDKKIQGNQVVIVEVKEIGKGYLKTISLDELKKKVRKSCYEKHVGK